MLEYMFVNSMRVLNSDSLSGYGLGAVVSG